MNRLIPIFTLLWLALLAPVLGRGMVNANGTGGGSGGNELVSAYDVLNRLSVNPMGSGFNP